MQQTWLRQHAEHADLVIFMLGWAANPNAVCHISPPGCDILVCYDYRSIEPLPPERFTRYRRIYLFAWSFGVWVSERCCRELPLHRAVALNGTPCPVDPRYGMRLRVVQRTMRTLIHHGGSNPFSAGNEAERYIPNGVYPDRSAEEKLEELNTLAEWADGDSSPHLRWDAAYIATQDEIFPPNNMRAWWNPLGLGTEFDSYHYPFSRPEIIFRELQVKESAGARVESTTARELADAAPDFQLPPA